VSRLRAPWVRREPSPEVALAVRRAVVAADGPAGVLGQVSAAVDRHAPGDELAGWSVRVGWAGPRCHWRVVRRAPGGGLAVDPERHPSQAAAIRALAPGWGAIECELLGGRAAGVTRLARSLPPGARVVEPAPAFFPAAGAAPSEPALLAALAARGVPLDGDGLRALVWALATDDDLAAALARAAEWERLTARGAGRQIPHFSPPGRADPRRDAL